MKKILFIVAICVSFTTIAQNLESKIPNSAEAVVSINGNRLVELVSVPEFDNYNFAQMMFKELSRKKDEGSKMKSVKEIGIDLNSKAFYFHKRTDSISYHNFLVKLTDKNMFESLMSPKNKENIISEGGVQIMVDHSSVAIWNDQMLLVSGYEKPYNFFKDNEERFKAQAETEDESYYTIKKRIASRWAKAYGLSIFNGNGGSSILNNKKYLASKDKDAAASVWVKNYGGLMNGFMSSIYGMSGMSSLAGLQGNMYNGFKSVVANLYFDKDATRMTMEMEVSSQWEKAFKKVYNSKMNKNFFNYFNQNDALAYMSFSMNMQALFEEYPTLMTSMYGGMMPQYKQEMDLSGDFMGLLLDEEAIGELMTGDMLFVLNDFGEKEVTYTSYEYDEDYKRKEVTKTKNDVVPDFTMMIGSKKGKLLNKAARLGIKYELIENKAGYYKVNVPKNEIPVDLYAVVKNDILFFTTSETKISNIVNDRFVKNLGKHQKMMQKNVSAFYVNGEKIMSRIPASELSKKEQGFMNYAKENFKDAYFKSSKMKGNKMRSEMKINTSSSQGNSLKTFLNFIEFAAK